jgi:hypothetical protein
MPTNEETLAQFETVDSETMKPVNTTVESDKPAPSAKTAEEKTVQPLETDKIKPVDDETKSEKVDKKEQDGGEEPPKQNKADRNYHKLLRERAEARAEAKLLREENARLQGTGTRPDQPTQQRQAPTDRPRRSDYANPDEYDDVMAAWTETKLNQAKDEGRRQAAVERRNQEITTNINEFKKTHADYDAKVKELDDMQLSDNLFHSIRDEVNPAAVSYYLAQHEDEVERINALPPLKIARELGRISAMLENGSSGTPAPRASRAPEPVVETTPGRVENKHEETDEEYAIRWKKAHHLIPA